MGASHGGAPDAALAAVVQAIDELDALTREGIDSGDSARLRARADRWKRATVEVLREHVSPEDVSLFARKPIAPTWVGMEDPFALLSSHRAYLVELAREIHDHPDRYRKRQSAVTPSIAAAQAASKSSVKGAVASPPEPKPPAPLPYPERVTLAWLFKHAPR